MRPHVPVHVHVDDIHVHMMYKCTTQLEFACFCRLIFHCIPSSRGGEKPKIEAMQLYMYMYI